MDVRRKINELKIDLQGLTDQRFADESDERVITGLIDKTLNSLDDLAAEADMLSQRLNIMERAVSMMGGFGREERAAPAKAAKPVKKAKPKKTKKAKKKPKPKKKKAKAKKKPKKAKKAKPKKKAKKPAKKKPKPKKKKAKKKAKKKRR